MANRPIPGPQFEGRFEPDDAALYGPPPGSGPRGLRPLLESLRLPAWQLLAVLALSLGIFFFLGGPLWRAPRGTFPLRLFTSYAVIPLAVAVLLARNGPWSWRTWLFTSAVLGGVKFFVTVVIDVGMGLLRHWPP